MRDFIRNIFSLEERKASTIMCSYISFCSVGIYLLFTTGNIPTPLSYIIISLAGLIAGVNIVPSFLNGINQNNSNKYNNQYINNTSQNINIESENGSI